MLDFVVLRAPVIDDTGLTGLYDYDLRFSTDEIPREFGYPSLQAALSELGLHLSSEKVLFDVIVVDRIDRVPTEN